MQSAWIPSGSAREFAAQIVGRGAKTSATLRGDDSRSEEKGVERRQDQTQTGDGRRVSFPNNNEKLFTVNLRLKD
jgi:hypothetical protein